MAIHCNFSVLRCVNFRLYVSHLALESCDRCNEVVPLRVICLAESAALMQANFFTCYLFLHHFECEGLLFYVRAGLLLESHQLITNNRI